MKTLFESLKKYLGLIVEGGMAGHMAHPIDFTYFTAKDLKDLISDLFEGRIEDITEKIDGTNIQATMNEHGDVLFLRNNKDLNNANGGMTIEDMATKWADKPSVANTFISAGQTIIKVFKNIDPKFFNPEPGKKMVANGECVIAGVTNIIPYAEAQVDFHDIYIYKYDGETWHLDEVTKKGLDVIDKACENIDSAKLTPKVIIEITKESNALIKKYHKMIDDLFGDDNVSIDGWKFVKFCEYVDNKYSWILDDPQGSKLLYNRWFKGDKSTNIKIIRQLYKDHVNELNELEKNVYKNIVADVIDPLDNIFIKLGNDIIRLCKGLINGSSNDSVIKHLQSEMQSVIKDVKANGTSETQAKLVRQLQRIENAGGESSINSVEGIVFKYKGKMMKLTGSFAPLNQILGTIKFSK